MEIWKDIKGFENYKISNLGKVKKSECVITYANGNDCFYQEKILKQEFVKGYKRVSLSKNGIVKRFSVHRLVAEYFINNQEKKPCVNHINGIKDDNRVSNLEWVSFSENEKHSYSVLKKINKNRKLTKVQVDNIISVAIKGRKGNIKKLSNFYRVDKSTIYNILNKKYYV